MERNNTEPANVNTTAKSKAIFFEMAAKDRSLNHGAFRLLALLHSYANVEGKCWPGHRALKKALGCDSANLTLKPQPPKKWKKPRKPDNWRRPKSPWLRQLVDAGYVSVKPRGQGFTYTLHYGTVPESRNTTVPESRNSNRSSKQEQNCTPQQHYPIEHDQGSLARLVDPLRGGDPEGQQAKTLIAEKGRQADPDQDLAEVKQSHSAPFHIPSPAEYDAFVDSHPGLDPDCAGGFWEDMIASSWTIRSEPVRDWQKALLARNERFGRYTATGNTFYSRKSSLNYAP